MSTPSELRMALDSARARARGIVERARAKEDDLMASAIGGATAAAAGYARGRWADNYGDGLILGAPAEAVVGFALLGAHVSGMIKSPAAKAAGDALFACYAFQMGLGAGLAADQKDKAAGR